MTLVKHKNVFAGMSVFKKREEKEFFAKGKSIAELQGWSSSSLPEGIVGLEVEVEGNKFPSSREFFDEELNEYVTDTTYGLIPQEWRWTEDGSLRGEDNAEYVLHKPLPFDEVPEAVDKLFEMLDDFGSVLDESNRTSVHVHLNVKDWDISRLTSFLTMIFIVEDVLTHWCGENRVGNLFCLRAVDAPQIVTQVKRAIRQGSFHSLSNGLHYSGVNVRAIRKHCSVEVRTMRGTRNPEDIKKWVSILRSIYERSALYSDPRDIVCGFSGQSQTSFLQNILGENVEEVLSGSGMSSLEIQRSLLQGIRVVQPLCYAIDWKKYQEAEINAQPIKSIKIPSFDYVEEETTFYAVEDTSL